jgi:hypothetical protein
LSRQLLFTAPGSDGAPAQLMVGPTNFTRAFNSLHMISSSSSRSRSSGLNASTHTADGGTHPRAINSLQVINASSSTEVFKTNTEGEHGSRTPAGRQLCA